MDKQLFISIPEYEDVEISSVNNGHEDIYINSDIDNEFCNLILKLQNKFNDSYKIKLYDLKISEKNPIGSGFYSIVFIGYKKTNLIKITNILGVIKNSLISNSTSYQFEFIKTYNNIILNFENELDSNLMYGNLKLKFPNNIMKIYDTKYCTLINYKDLPNYKDLQSDKRPTLYLPVNIIEMERINNNYLFTKSSTYHEIFSGLIQELYITCYSNLQGIFHNDLHVQNVIYKLSKDVKYKLNDLYINSKIVVIIKPDKGYILYPYFIDYSISFKLPQITNCYYCPYEMLIIIDKYILFCKTHLDILFFLRKLRIKLEKCLFNNLYKFNFKNIIHSDRNSIPYYNNTKIDDINNLKKIVEIFIDIKSFIDDKKIDINIINI